MAKVLKNKRFCLYFRSQLILRRFANSIVNVWNKLPDVAMQYIHKGSQVQVTSEWLRPSACVDQSGTPQTSIDMDASRLVLLDRSDNGDSSHTPEDIVF